MFTVKFDTDNEAFTDNYTGEIAIIFERIVKLLHSGCTEGTIHDTNGNSIGSWRAR